MERYNIGLCKVTTIKGAAAMSGLCWDAVKDIEKRRLQKKYKHIPLRGLRLPGIDEVAVRKGHHYATIVIDLESGHIVWVGKGRNAKSLGEFLKKLKRSGARIEAFSMDMSAAYYSAVKEFYPNTPVVYDHFHVIQQMNTRLDELRRQYVRDLQQKFRQSVKGVRWLVLMSSEKVKQLAENKPSYKMRLARALRLNKPLATGYYLKEELRLLWSLPEREKAKTFLHKWCKKSRASKLKPLEEMANLLERHQNGILAYFDHRISNGPVEGVVNKIKTLKRAAYGYRDWEFFTLKLYGLHESKVELVG